MSEEDISAYIVTGDNICILVTICAAWLDIYYRRRQSMQDDNAPWAASTYVRVYNVREIGHNVTKHSVDHIS